MNRLTRVAPVVVRLRLLVLRVDKLPRALTVAPLYERMIALNRLTAPLRLHAVLQHLHHVDKQCRHAVNQFGQAVAVRQQATQGLPR